MPVLAYRGIRPRLGRRVYVAPTAHIGGDLEVGDDVSFWFNTAARADVNSIRIGARSNIQDGAVLHVSYETHSLSLGEGVVIGHGAIVHGCTIESGALVGIGARVLDGATIGAAAQIGAGAVVAPETTVPPGVLVLGIPGRVTRDLTPRELESNAAIADRYVEIKDTWAMETGYGTGARWVEPREEEEA